MSTITPPKRFSGTRHEFNQYNLDLIRFAEQSGTSVGQLGFLPFLMSEEQLNRTIGNDPAPESQLLPKPELDSGANQAAILIYKVALDQYERQQAQWANFKNGLNGSLNQATMNALQSQDRGMRGIAPATIYAYLTTTYGTVTPADLLKYHTELELPLRDDNDLDSFLSQLTAKPSRFHARCTT